MKTTLIERLHRYCSFATGSDPKSSSTPSTPEQSQFLNMLSDELNEFGAEDILIDQSAILYCTIPATDPAVKTVVGMIAHVDTSPDAPSDNIKPIIHPDYDGKELRLPHLTLSPKEFPELELFKGHTLITSDGSTLLGADDKAGVAILLSLLEYLKDNKEIKHGKIRLAFTTDEEIGKGADLFDLDIFGADFAYTFDSGGIGFLERENFNAAGAVVTIKGKNIHPGYAFNKMINAANIATSYSEMIFAPNPAQSKGRMGFIHLNEINATVELAKLGFIIRAFDMDEFEGYKQQLIDLAGALKMQYAGAEIDVTITDQYENMATYIPDYVVDIARDAIREAGLEPTELPIRGGTDGARLSVMGLPTPNLFTGGMNFHSKAEYCSVEAMVKALEVATIIAKTVK